MGRRYDEVGDEMKRIPYKVVKGEHDDARIEIFGKVYSPPQISAMILGKLKSAAYCARPVVFTGPSTRGSAAPITGGNSVLTSACFVPFSCIAVSFAISS